MFVAPLCGLFWLIDSGMRTSTEAAQLFLTNLRQGDRARMLRIICTLEAVAASFTARRGQQKDLDAFGCVFCQRSFRH